MRAELLPFLALLSCYVNRLYRHHKVSFGGKILEGTPYTRARPRVGPLGVNHTTPLASLLAGRIDLPQLYMILLV